MKTVSNETWLKLGKFSEAKIPDRRVVRIDPEAAKILMYLAHETKHKQTYLASLLIKTAFEHTEITNGNITFKEYLGL